MSKIDKLVIVGLAGADPSLAFERWLDDLPNLRQLTETGVWGRLESCCPPQAIPAWSCMASSKDPGTIGVYGSRGRRDWSYEELGVASNLEMRQPRLWDYVARAGRDSLIVGVPQTFPILRAPRGVMVTGFLTPNRTCPYTHPSELADELEELVGHYHFDVEDIPPDNRSALRERISAVTEQRFRVCRHLISTRPWSLMWMVDMGIARMQSAFWRYMDPAHREHLPNHALADAIHDYYVEVDARIGELVATLDRDRTAICVVSDHGAKRLDGGFCLNDWLIREGLLTLNAPVASPRRLEMTAIDWSRTKAWADGGCSGACYLNVAGREPHGVVPQEEYESLRESLMERIEALPGPDGKPITTRVFRPDSLYRELRGYPPDLVVVAGNYHYQVVGQVGHDGVWVTEPPGGADDATCAMNGLYVFSHGSLPSGPRDATIYDILPTCLRLLSLKPPRGLAGRPLVDH